MSPWPSLGVHYGLTHAQYFAPREYRGQRIFSKSLAAQFAPDPAVWKALDDAGGSEPESDSISWGTLVDLLAFRPQDFARSYAVAPATYTSAPEKVSLTTEFEGEWNGRTKVCREWRAAREAEGFAVMTPDEAEAARQPKPWNWNSATCQQWAASIRAERPGCQIVTDEEIAEARKAVEILQAHPGYQELVEGAHFQVAMLAALQSVPVRGALDILPARGGRFGDCLADLKTCSRMGSVRELQRHVLEYGYHVQAWLYLSLWNALNPDDKRRRFVFVFQSSRPPYEIAILEMKHEAMLSGGVDFIAAFDRWKECTASGEWPSKWEGVEFISVPAYALEGRGFE